MEQLGTVDGRTFDEWPTWEAKGLPTFDNCDQSNPRQAFLPMFTAMPGMQGAPLILPTDYWECVSWRMWVLGARPTGAPQLKYQPPANMVADRWTAAGQWVTLDTPDPERPTLASEFSGLSQADRAEIQQIVMDRIGMDRPQPGAPAGHLRVDEMAGRLGLEVADLVKVLESFGMPAKPDSFVGRDVADRIVAHLDL